MQKYRSKQISVGKKRLNAIVADSFTKRMVGLMFRKSLPKNACMLFMFGREGMHCIWMRNMRFPIDAIWLDKDCRIVGMRAEMGPCKSLADCKTYCPERPARYAIEMNAGDIRKMGINPSTKIVLG